MLRYPGGKTKVWHQIVEKLSKFNNTNYLEPFFGGGSIGLKLIANPITKIWINDKDVGIANLWTAIIRYPEELKKLIHSFVPSVEVFFKFKEELVSELTGEIVEIGFKKLVIHQLSYSGLGTKSGGPLGGITQKSKYKIDCRWSVNHLCKNIDKCHNILKKVEIHENCCTNLDFALVNLSNSLSYYDPPYYQKGNDLYQYGFSLEDHKRLCNFLKNKENWVLSYDECREIREMYSWAKISTLRVSYNIKGIKTKTELLICK